MNYNRVWRKFISALGPVTNYAARARRKLAPIEFPTGSGRITANKMSEKREHNTISITKRGSVHWIQIPVFLDCPPSIVYPRVSLYIWSLLRFSSARSVNTRNGTVCISLRLYPTRFYQRQKQRKFICGYETKILPPSSPQCDNAARGFSPGR